jgi:hypothetical protein
LAHYDEPYPDNKKVRTLLWKMNTNDPHINAGIAHVRSNALMLFDGAVSYLADIIRLAPSTQTQVTPNNPARRVAASNTRQGRVFGRSGRSVNSNTQTGRTHTVSTNDRSDFVSHEVWGLLTPAQRSAIARDRGESDASTMSYHGGYGRGGRGYNYRGRGRGRFDPNRGGGRGTYQGRNINAVSVERRTDYSDMSQMTESAAAPLQNNAGQSFGRTAYHNPTVRGANTTNNNSSNAQANGDNRHNRVS